MAVSDTPIVLNSLEQGGSALPPDPAAASEVALDGGHCSLPLLGRKQWQEVP